MEEKQNSNDHSADVSVLFGAQSGSEQASQADEQVRYGIHLGELGLLIPQETFSEVVVAKDIYPLPNTQPWLKGVINDHGDVVPVYDLLQLFRLEATQAQKEALLVIDQREYAVAIFIRQYPQPVRGVGEPAETTTDVPEVLQEYVKAVYQVGGERWIDFNHRDFFRSLKAWVAL